MATRSLPAIQFPGDVSFHRLASGIFASGGSESTVADGPVGSVKDATAEWIDAQLRAQGARNTLAVRILDLNRATARAVLNAT
ncbi:MAG: hypothetical protein WA802_12575 [Terracidiphilus sp.]